MRIRIRACFCVFMVMYLFVWAVVFAYTWCTIVNERWSGRFRFIRIRIISDRLALISMRMTTARTLQSGQNEFLTNYTSDVLQDGVFTPLLFMYKYNHFTRVDMQVKRENVYVILVLKHVIIYAWVCYREVNVCNFYV